jgi:hypothetical protein
MGNRCVITTEPYAESNVGIYLHWNGGIESVEAFVAAAKELGYRAPGNDFGMARLCGLACLFFGLAGDTSVGVGTLDELDLDGDNGVWLLDPNDWKITGHRPRSDVKHASKPPRNREPDKTESIRKTLVLAARTCQTACRELGCSGS